MKSAMRLVMGLALVGFGLGCEDTNPSAPGAVVFADFDPSATPPRVPAPTDLAIDPTTGKISLPLGPTSSQAERDFASYLAGLDAFPPASTAYATFSAPLDSSTVRDDTVIVLDVSTASPSRVIGATISYDPVSGRLNVVPPGGAWPSGHKIAVAVRGGASGVHGMSGLRVVAQPAFFFARATTPISNCVAPTGSDCKSNSPVIPVAVAIQLERLRLALAPLFRALEAMSIPRDEVAVAWIFSVSQRPFGAYNPAAARVPFPNDILRDPITHKVKLPASPTDSALVTSLKNSLNMLTGFSTTGRITAQADLVPGRALVGTLPLGAVVTTLPAPVIGTRTSNIVIAPMTPLPENTRVFTVVTRNMTDDMGTPLEAPPFMALLRGNAPVSDGSHSLVSALTDADAAQLEPFRMQLSQALDAAAIPRDRVVLAWAFTTQPTFTELKARVDALPGAGGAGTEMPLPGAPVPTDKLDKLFAGTINGSKGQPLPFLLTTAKTPNGKIVLFQHGLLADKSSMFAIANTLGNAGFATAAIDLPFAGARAVTGKSFFDLTSLGGIRENVLEAAADLVQLRKAATTTGLAGQVFAGTDKVDFVGVSLGGYVGASYVAVDSANLGHALFSTVGAPLVDVLLESQTFRPMVDAALQAANITAGSPLFDQFVDLARWQLDAGDPINYALRLASRGSGKPVKAQLAEQDVVMPVARERALALAASMNTADLGTSGTAGHAVLVNVMDPGNAAAQADMIDFLTH